MNGKELMKKNALDALVDGWQDMLKRGHVTMEIDLTNGELEYLIELVRKDTETDKTSDWEEAYHQGYQYGYQMAIKDMIKKLKGLKWYGGRDNTEECAAGVPEHHAGRAADPEQKL